LKEVAEAEASLVETVPAEVPAEVHAGIAKLETPVHRTPARKAKLAETSARRKPGPQPGFKKRREEEAAKAKSQPSLAPETVEPQAEAEEVEATAGSFTGDLT
jgi:hypothetical protein